MKLTTIAAVMGAAATAEAEVPTNENMTEVEDYSNIDQVCQEYSQIDEQSMLELENQQEVERSSYQNHSKIAAENRKILATEKLCSNWVKTHKRHNVICKWCNKSVQPSTHWKFYGGVWYRWYDNKWHYWGPSKGGYGGRWRWSGGNWHHNGYTYKYVGGKWYRFYNHKWHYYSKMIPINPKPPVSPKTCVKAYHMVKSGIPTSLTSRRVPRCQVGSSIYMWGGSKVCKVLGGRLTYRKLALCKSGTAHKWRKVTKCTGGDIYRPQSQHETLNVKMTYTPGRALDIGAGGGKVWVVGTYSKNKKYGHQVYQRVGNKWVQNNAQAARVAVDESGRVYIVQATGHMYRRIAKKGAEWARINGMAGDIGVGGGKVWVTSKSGTSNAKYGNYIWSYDLKTGKWARDSGLANRLDVDASGSPWVVNKYNNIYYKYKGKGAWKHYPGKATDIAANGKAVALVGTDKRIYRLNHESKDWATTNTRNAKEVSIDNDGRLYEVNTSGYIYFQK